MKNVIKPWWCNGPSQTVKTNEWLCKSVHTQSIVQRTLNTWTFLLTKELCALYFTLFPAIIFDPILIKWQKHYFTKRTLLCLHIGAECCKTLNLKRKKRKSKNFPLSTIHLWSFLLSVIFNQFSLVPNSWVKLKLKQTKNTQDILFSLLKKAFMLGNT